MQNLDKVKEQIELELEVPEICVTHNKYNHIKKHKEQYEDWFVGYVGFIDSFGGKFFGGFSGYSEKIERNYHKEKAKNLYKQIPLLKNIEFIEQDYSNIEVKNCVIYCDPPYKDYKTSDIYNANFDTENFFNWCREQSKYNHVFVSESIIPDDFEIVWKYENATSALTLKEEKPSKIELLGYICNM